MFVAIDSGGGGIGVSTCREMGISVIGVEAAKGAISLKAGEEHGWTRIFHG
jgi:hypothetical protein